jgi:hypothetical protein
MISAALGPIWVQSAFRSLLFQAAQLTPAEPTSRSAAAYAVYPLIGGGVAEWLKAAVC